MDFLSSKTRWVIKFSDSTNKKILNKRVVIGYIPLENKFVFTGQYKIGDFHIDFSKKEVVLGKELIGYDDTTNTPIYNEINVNNIDIDSHILEVYLELEERANNYQIFLDIMKEYKDEIKIDYENKEENGIGNI